MPASSIERAGGTSFIYFLMGEAVSDEKINNAKRQILSILTMNHGKWDGKYEKFIVQEMGAILENIDTVTVTITAFVTIIANITLMVAGIGIMNIIILNQFVLETLILCGGVGLWEWDSPPNWSPLSAACGTGRH